ncbi:MAG: ParB/RepB/Spo0J family partition protein [Flavobacteriales bacterium AspAUS03]
MNFPKKRVLIRWFSPLLSENIPIVNSTRSLHAEGSIGHIIEIHLDKITVNPYQPRTRFNQERLQELSDSIRSFNVIQSITIRKEKNTFQLISGERRYHTCKLTGLNHIPDFVESVNDTGVL